MSRRYAADDFFAWSPEQEAGARVASSEGGTSMLRDLEGGRPQLMTLGLKSPANIGGVLRLAGCFGVCRVHHVGAWEWRDGGKQHATAAPKGSGAGYFFSMGEHEQRAMLSTAKGCEALVAHASWSLQALMDFLDEDRGGAGPPRRLPLVVMELAEGAVPIHSYEFPRDCVILVGAESSGVDRRVVQRLIPGFDALVYVPMPGAHKSLNVVEATCCACYEYRRQWPFFNDTAATAAALVGGERDASSGASEGTAQRGEEAGAE
jgi:tRNA(Leu) C34 or U34 (ribose-2'-O)-methylase TrmL|eukprot:4938959-Prymnesium_polylepis.1